MPDDRSRSPETDPADRDYVLSRLARKVPGVGVADTASGQLDMLRLRAYRLGRLQAELQKLDVGGILLGDAINIRYATGVRNMQAWSLHALIRMAFVPTEGKAVCFEYAGSEHLAQPLETVAEVRPSGGTYRAGVKRDATGERDPAVVAWAVQIAELVRQQGSKRLAIDRMIGHFVALALSDQGLTLVAGGPALGQAQAIKSADEIQCITLAVAATETGMARMRDALEPGITENELWAVLNGTNIALGGEYSDTRLLSSGGRTNPWYQEATDRRVRPGELVSFDTDMIGPFGYDADISRAFFCGPGRPSAEQRRLYRTAYEQLQHNLALVRPGRAFREMSELAFRLPEAFWPNQMAMTWHGVGLYGQWPTIVGYKHYKPDSGLDGVVQPGMVLCCESYVGAVGGLEGVKLEQQLAVTEDGYELLTTFPFEDELLGREL